MPSVTMNISLPVELRRSVERRVHSGRYGNGSDVFRASLRVLDREEVGEAWREWQEIRAKLPQDPLTPEIEGRIAARVRSLRPAGKRKAAK